MFVIRGVARDRGDDQTSATPLFLIVCCIYTWPLLHFVCHLQISSERGRSLVWRMRNDPSKSQLSLGRLFGALRYYYFVCYVRHLLILFAEIEMIVFIYVYVFVFDFLLFKRTNYKIQIYRITCEYKDDTQTDIYYTHYVAPRDCMAHTIFITWFSSSAAAAALFLFRCILVYVYG